MTTTTAYLTNEAYGYPRGAKRRTEPVALICVHITGNPNTPPATAIQERNYANREGSNGPSAHNYIDRNGDDVVAIDADKYAAWSNGDVKSPVLSWPGITNIAVNWPANGRNPNEAYYREVECCGRPGSYPLTVAQKATLARLIAEDHMKTGIAIGRGTVHTHSLLNTETRPSCPVPADDRTDFIDDLIAAAKAQVEIMKLKQENAELTASLTAAYQKIDLDEATITALNAKLAAQEEALAAETNRANTYEAALKEIDKEATIEVETSAIWRVRNSAREHLPPDARYYSNGDVF